MGVIGGHRTVWNDFSNRKILRFKERKGVKIAAAAAVENDDLICT